MELPERTPFFDLRQEHQRNISAVKRVDHPKLRFSLPRIVFEHRFRNSSPVMRFNAASVVYASALLAGSSLAQEDVETSTNLAERPTFTVSALHWLEFIPNRL